MVNGQKVAVQKVTGQKSQLLTVLDKMSQIIFVYKMHKGIGQKVTKI